MIPTAPATRDPGGEHLFITRLRKQFPHIQAGDDNLLMLARHLCDLLDAGAKPKAVQESLIRTFGSDEGRLMVAVNTLIGASTTMCPSHQQAVADYERSVSGR